MCNKNAYYETTEISDHALLTCVLTINVPGIAL